MQWTANSVPSFYTNCFWFLDDDVDQIDDADQNLNEKHLDEKIKSPEQLQLRGPMDDKQDGVMVQPK